MSKGSVLGLFISIKGQENRVDKEEVKLEQEGVVGDKFFAKGADRSVLIASKSSYDMALKEGVEVPFGSLGENILIDINPYGLSQGDEIEIGEVVLQITNNCTICNSLAKVDPILPELLANDRGIFAKTIKDGYIRKGDTVNIKKY